MKRKADIVIIGGGINGCALAYRLAKQKKTVVLLEKNYLSSGATGSCGAGIRQQWSTKENIELAMHSVKMFEGLNTELNADIEFRQGGYLIINHTEKELKQSKQNVALQRSLNLDVEIVDVSDIQRIVPILDVKAIQAIGATFCPTDGHANPFKTTFAFARASEKHGASLYTHTTVKQIKKKKDYFYEIQTDKGTLTSTWVINAAGVWSKDLAKQVSIDLPNTPFRKEAMATERLQPLFDAMVISFRDGIYFSQQAEGQIVGGIPIPEERSGFRFMPTYAFLEHMSHTLTRYAPILKQVNMLRHWTGFYDVTLDARPILGEDEHTPGFVHCHGFSGHGFMLAPMVSKLISDQIIDKKTSSVLQRLSLKRFENPDLIQEQNVVG